jgi:predicted metalloprotease
VQSLAKLTSLLGVLPGFAYYNDSDGSNAKATPEKLLDRSDGTVIFGLQLLKECLARPANGDASIVAICAHEYGHIVSYKNGMIGQLDTQGSGDQGVFRAEQFADYIAGYYAGTRRRENRDFPAVAFATTQRSFGGGDHGSGKQRGDAVQAGFLAAYQRNLGRESAFQDALKFCMGRTIEY